MTCAEDQIAIALSSPQGAEGPVRTVPSTNQTPVHNRPFLTTRYIYTNGQTIDNALNEDAYDSTCHILQRRIIGEDSRDKGLGS